MRPCGPIELTPMERPAQVGGIATGKEARRGSRRKGNHWRNAWQLCAGAFVNRLTSIAWLYSRRADDVGDVSSPLLRRAVPGAPFPEQ
jgi:hypothetical protein